MSVLRRADWRFLLPARADGAPFRRLVVLGAGAGTLAPLAPLAQEVSASLDALAAADAVVATAESAVPVRRLLAQVPRDAVLYLEVDRRRARHMLLAPGAVRRTFRRTGFRATACYWVVPSFEHARRHVPLDAPEALHWYLRTLQTSGSVAARAADIGVRVLAAAGGDGLGAMVPCYAVVALGPEAPPLVPAAPGVPPGPVVMVTSGQDDGSRVVLLPFEPGGAHPVRAVKVSRLPAFAAHTQREQETLSGLRARLPAALRSSLPEPLGVRQWQGLLVSAESYAPGTPLVVTTGRRGGSFAAAREDLRRTVDWLIAFHRALASADTAWNSACAAARLARCRELVGAGGDAARLLDAAAAPLLGPAGSPGPLVPLHNDLGPWNVHRHREHISVIDWELGEGEVGARRGPGAFDLFYFATTWFLRARHYRSARDEAPGVGELFVPPRRNGRAADAVHDEVLRYAHAFDLAPPMLPALLVATWAERALDRIDRAGLAAPGAAGAASNRYLDYLEALAPARSRWFEERRWP